MGHPCPKSRLAPSAVGVHTDMALGVPVLAEVVWKVLEQLLIRRARVIVLAGGHRRADVRRPQLAARVWRPSEGRLQALHLAEHRIQIRPLHTARRCVRVRILQSSGRFHPPRARLSREAEQGGERGQLLSWLPHDVLKGHVAVADGLRDSLSGQLWRAWTSVLPLGPACPAPLSSRPVHSCRAGLAYIAVTIR